MLCGSFRQAQALGAAVIRELVWGLRAVSREVDKWRAQAAAIPDMTIRTDALDALEHKRPNTDGAALLWTLPEGRYPGLLRLIVAYEIMGDFLDSTVERGAHVGIANGRQLHLALVDAIDVDRPTSDYYRHHPWKDDGGYLQGLVEACRIGCAMLPSYRSIRPLLLRAATLAQVQGLNHEPDIPLREEVLEAWAAQEGDPADELDWHETAGAGSAWLTVIALLAVAAEPVPAAGHGFEVFLAYSPWIGLTAALLDSYGDLGEDQYNQANSFISRYGSLRAAVERIDEIALRATHEARCLRSGHRHVVIVASMIALYLSKDSTRTPEMKQFSWLLLHAGGPLAMLLAPVLRIWRVAYLLREA